MAGPTKQPVSGTGFGSFRWRDPVDTPIDLPLMGNVEGDRRTVLDDGDGKPADYEWDGLVWSKMADPDSSGLAIPVLISQGGTSATTASSARDNLVVVERPAIGLLNQLGGTDFITDTYRPYLNPVVIPTSIYVDIAGNDITGDGTIGNPFATVERALQVIPVNQGSAVQLYFSAGNFTLPDILTLTNWTHFNGNLTVEETRNIVSVTSADNPNGIVFTVDGSALVDDQWRGRQIRYQSGKIGWCYKNTANLLYVTQEDDPIIAPAIAEIIDLMSLNTTFDFVGSAPTAMASVQLNFLDCYFSDFGAIWFVISTDKVGFNRCRFDLLNLRMGGYGRSHLETCYVANIGTTSQGIVSSGNGGFMLLEEGTVIDCGMNSDPSKKFVDADGSSIVRFQDEVVLVDAEANGFRFDGIDVAIAENRSDRDLVRFINCAGGFNINTTGEGNGGDYQLPHLYGTLNVGSTFVVIAGRGAQVELGENSNLLTNGGAGVTNLVSSNLGLTAWAEHPDGTRIVNGTPQPRGYRSAGVSLLQGHVLADDGTDWVLAETLAINNLWQVEALSPTSAIIGDRVVGVTEGALAPLRFFVAPASIDNGKQVYLDENNPGFGSLVAPLTSGHMSVPLGRLEGADGVSVTPLVRFDPEEGHVV